MSILYLHRSKCSKNRRKREIRDIIRDITYLNSIFKRSIQGQEKQTKTTYIGAPPVTSFINGTSRSLRSHYINGTREVDAYILSFKYFCQFFKINLNGGRFYFKFTKKMCRRFI